MSTWRCDERKVWRGDFQYVQENSQTCDRPFKQLDRSLVKPGGKPSDVQTDHTTLHTSVSLLNTAHPPHFSHCCCRCQTLKRSWRTFKLKLEAKMVPVTLPSLLDLSLRGVQDLTCLFSIKAVSHMAQVSMVPWYCWYGWWYLWYCLTHQPGAGEPEVEGEGQRGDRRLLWGGGGRDQGDLSSSRGSFQLCLI